MPAWFMLHVSTRKLLVRSECLYNVFGYFCEQCTYIILNEPLIEWFKFLFKVFKSLLLLMRQNTYVCRLDSDNRLPFSQPSFIISALQPSQCVPPPPIYSTELESQLRTSLFTGYEVLQRPFQTVVVAVTLNLLNINSLVRLLSILYESYQNQYTLIDAFNPLPPKDTFWNICSRRLLKTLWQKEKFINTSNSSFCHNVFNYLK